MKYIKNYIIFNENVGKVSISDKSNYNKQMQLSHIDKLFFLNITDFDVIVDFGCADGFILNEISKIDNNINLIGYDIDNDMLNIARKSTSKSIKYYSNWEFVKSEIKNYKNPLLLLSSVIHEVYSYTNGSNINKFWNDVFNSGFKYIVIRDMIPSISSEKIKEFENDVIKIRKFSNPDILNSFENEWGSISNNYRTLIHYLLKYKYEKNWNRELLENYVPLTIETLKNKIPNNYKIIYEEHYILEHLSNTVFKDFKISIKTNTHLKLILKLIN